MKITTVDIVGMHKISHATIDIKNVMYFYGPNGSGKSTMLQAIQLGLLGYIPGTAKTKTAIFSHANSDKMCVKITFDDNSYVYREWIKSGADIQYTEDISSDLNDILKNLSIPVLDINALLDLSANKLKDWFVSFLPKTDSLVDWNYVIGSMVIQDYDPVFMNELLDDAIKSGCSGVECVRAFNAAMKEKQSVLKADIARLQSTLQSLVYYDDVDMNLDIDALQMRKKLLLDDIKALIAKREACLANEKALDEINKLKKLIDITCTLEQFEYYNTIVDERSSYDVKLSDLENQLSALDNKKLELNMQAASLNHGDGGVCPYTNEMCQTALDAIRRNDEVILNIQKEIFDIEDKTMSLKALRDGILQRAKALDTQIQSIRYCYDHLNYMKSTLKDVNEDISTIKAWIADTEDKLNDVQDMIGRYLANQKYEELSADLAVEKLNAEQNLDIVKRLIRRTDVNGLQQELMNRSFTSFAHACSGHVVKFFGDSSMSLQFNLSSKANSFSFGLKTNDTYVPYELLSSGEKCLVILAVLLNISKRNSIPVLLVDDFLDHLDEDRATKCFDALCEITDTQVIIAGVKPCTSEKFKPIIMETEKLYEH